MKNLKLLSLYISFFLILDNQAFAQSVFTGSNGKISFFSEARLENIEAGSTKISSVLNIATGEMIFKVSIKSFVFRNSLMQEHFNENYMESDKYPEAIFTGKINEPIDNTTDGEFKVTVTGKLTMHGLTKERTIPGIILIKKGQLSIKSDFIVPVSDYHIDIPNDKLSNISQDISIKLQSDYVPYVKK
jgi:polyisoprenoid-binding protein YceI